MQNASSQYSEIINKISRDFNNLDPLLKKVISMILSSIDDNFAAGGRWDGVGTDITSGGTHKWVPLSDSTIKGYKRKGWNNLNATLNRSGSGLRSSVTAKVDNGKSIVIGSNKEYAAIHQFGGQKAYSGANKTVIERKFKFGRHNVSIPARPFVTLTEKDLNDIVIFS